MLNIDSNTLNSILLAIIIAIVIIIFIKMTKSGKKENMHVKENDIDSRHKFDHIINPKPNCDGEETQSTITSNTSS